MFKRLCIVLACVLLPVSSVLCAEAGMPKDNLAGSLSGVFQGKAFNWFSHVNWCSDAGLMKDGIRIKFTPPPASILEQNPRAREYSNVRLSFDHPDNKGTDLSEYSFLKISVTIQGISNFLVSFCAREGAEGLLFPEFYAEYANLIPGKKTELTIPLRTGTLGLIYKQAIEKQGKKLTDVTPEDYKAVMRNLSRIDFSLYGTEDREMIIHDVTFVKED